MSRTSHTCSFTERHFSFRRELIANIITASQPAKNVVFVSRASQPNRDWDLSCDQESEEDVSSPPRTMTFSPEISRQRVATDQVPEMFSNDDKLLSIDLSSATCTILGAVENSIRSIKATIVGDFEPSEFHLRVGWHDLFKFMENESGTYFGRPFMSIVFWGWRYPEDWPEFRRRVFDMAALIKVKRDVSASAGPLHQCFFCDP